MGFVVEGRDWSDGDEEGEPSFSAFVFESNTEGEKVFTLMIWPKGETCSLMHKWILNLIFFFSLFTDMLYHQFGKGHYRSQEGNAIIWNHTDSFFLDNWNIMSLFFY